VRDNIDAAQSGGRDAVRLKWVGLPDAAAANGLNGALIFCKGASRLKQPSPDRWTANVIFIVVIGGIRTIAVGRFSAGLSSSRCARLWRLRQWY